MDGVGEAQAHEDGAQPGEHARDEPRAQDECLVVVAAVVFARAATGGVQGDREQDEEGREQDHAHEFAASELEREQQAGGKRRDVLQPEAVRRALEGIEQHQQPGKVERERDGAGDDHLHHVLPARDRDHHEREQDEAGGEEAVVVAIRGERSADAQRDVRGPGALLEAAVEQAEAREHEERGPGVHPKLGVIGDGVVHEGAAQHGAGGHAVAELAAHEREREQKRRSIRDERGEAVGPGLVAEEAVEGHEDGVEEGRMHIGRRRGEHLLEAHVREQDREALVAPEVVGEDARDVDAQQGDHQQCQQRGADAASAARARGLRGGEVSGGCGGLRRRMGACGRRMRSACEGVACARRRVRAARCGGAGCR